MTAECWDAFERDALAAGVPQHLAVLGRDVMRDVYQHGLDQSITLGTVEDAPLLIDWMLAAPTSAEARLLGDQMSRAGVHCNEVEDLAVEMIANRLAVDFEDVQDLLRGEEGASRAALARHADR